MIGDRIKKLRKEKSLSQQELADLLDTSPSYVSEIEKGKKIPGGNLLFSLKRVFGVSIDYLMSGEEDANNHIVQPAKQTSIVVDLIEKLLLEMNEEAQRDVLKYAEEKKQLSELLAKKKKRRAVNGD